MTENQLVVPCVCSGYGGDGTLERNANARNATFRDQLPMSRIASLLASIIIIAKINIINFKIIIIVARISIIIEQFSNEIDKILFSSNAHFQSIVRICANWID